MWAFYKQCLARALTKAWDATNAVSLVVGVGIGVLVWRLPQFRDRFEPLYWLIPVGAFVSWFVYRFGRAPVELYEELKAHLEDAQARASSAEAALTEHRDCQAVADFLTQEHHYGVHELLHKPPRTPEDLDQWNRWVDNWNQALFLRIQQMGCTLQELEHVRTIAMPDVIKGPMMIRGDNLEIAVRMHAVRLTRVGEIAAKYAQRAERLKSQ